MDIEQTKKDIKQALSGMPIPNANREDAEQEGFIAALEGKDIKKHVRLWLKGELAFRDKLGFKPDGAGYSVDELQDAENQARRLHRENPKHEKELVDGKLVAYREV